MSSPDSEVRAVLKRAEAEARRSQRGVWGSGEILLALLVGPASTAGDALRELRVDRDAAADELRRLRPSAPDHGKPRRGNEVDYVIERATSIAAFQGASEVGIDQLLLGLLWERDSAASRVLQAQDIGYEDCYRMVFGDHPPRDLTPPPLVPANFGEPATIAIGDLPRVLAHLEATLPKGQRHAFNVEGDKAVVWADERVDLPAAIRTALAGSPK